MRDQAAQDRGGRGIRLRMRKEDYALIEQAAKSRGKSLPAFIVDAAHRAAADTFADEGADNFEGETPDGELPRDDEGFQRLMRTPLPWD